MGALAAVVRALLMVVPVLLQLRGVLFFIWRWFKTIALHPVTWITASLLPTLSLLVELFTGKNFLVSGIINDLIASMLNKLLDFVLPVDLTEEINSLPATVLQMCCYLGVTEALQTMINGMVSAMTILLAIKINFFIAYLKIRLATMKRM